MSAQPLGTPRALREAAGEGGDRQRQVGPRSAGLVPTHPCLEEGPLADAFQHGLCRDAGCVAEPETPVYAEQEGAREDPNLHIRPLLRDDHVLRRLHQADRERRGLHARGFPTQGPPAQTSGETALDNVGGPVEG